MVRIRVLESKDLPFAVSLANTMNWNMNAADFEFNMQLEPNGCFLSQAGPEQNGLATCISYVQVGWFGNLIVSEAYREQGVGTKLVRAAMKYLASRNVRTIGLYAYPQLADFYSKLGFKPEVDFSALKADSVCETSTETRNFRIIKAQDLSTIADFDAEFFGACRERLFDLLFKNPHNLGYVAFEGSKVVGFVASKVFGEFAEVGPLVCLRSKPEIAQELLNTILSRLNGFEALVYIPTSELILLNNAYNAGFKEEFRLKRMFFGPVLAKNCIYLAESLERG